MPQQDPTYIDKLYGALQQDGAVKLTISKDEFAQRIGSDDAYREKVYGALQKSPKVKLTITPDEFTLRTRIGEPPGKTEPDGSGALSGGQQTPLEGQQTGSRAFDPIKQYKEVVPGVPENATQKKNAVVSEYEKAQKEYADESKFNLNVAGTAEKYIGKPLSQNFEQQRNEVKLIKDTHEKVLAEKRKASDYYQQKVVDEVVKPKVAEVLKDGGHASFTMKNDIGNVDVVDPYKVGKKADQIAIQNGQPTDGFFRRYVYNTLKNETNFKIIEGDIKKTFDQKAAPLLSANQKKIEEGFTTDEVEAAKFKDATTALAQDLSVQQQAEADAISNEYKQLAEAGQNPSYDEYLKQLNVINSKYNKRYQREADPAAIVIVNACETPAFLIVRTNDPVPGCAVNVVT